MMRRQSFPGSFGSRSSLGRPTLSFALATCLIAAAAASVSAQTALTLSDATGRAIAKNRDIVIERESANIADANIERARGAYDPVLRGEARYRDSKVPTTSVLSGAPDSTDVVGTFESR